MNNKKIEIILNNNSIELDIPLLLFNNLVNIKEYLKNRLNINSSDINLEYTTNDGEIINILDGLSLRKYNLLINPYNLKISEIDKDGDIIMNDIESESEDEEELAKSSTISEIGKSAIKQILKIVSMYGMEYEDNPKNSWIYLKMCNVNLLTLGKKNKGSIEEGIIATLNNNDYIENGLGTDINSYLKFHEKYGNSGRMMYDPRGKPKSVIEEIFSNLMDYYTD